MRARLASKQIRAKAIYRSLTKNYPNVSCELDHKNAFELLVATVLSAQCTDKRVNQITPALFKKYKTIKTLTHPFFWLYRRDHKCRDRFSNF